MKKYIVMITLLACNSFAQAAPFVTNFINTSPITINLELHLSDKSIINKTIEASKSLPVVNFIDKLLTEVIFSSSDQDKNGNLYGQLKQAFTVPKSDVTYNIALQDIPGHTVDAGVGTEKFEMPATQTIVCSIANKIDDKIASAVKKVN